MIRVFAGVVLALLALVPAVQALTRDQAKTIVINQVLNPSPYLSTLAAYSYDPPGAEDLLRAGDVVRPFDRSSEIVITEDTWFFWIDYTPARWFVHPAAFVMVSDANANVTVIDVEWFPEINGTPVYFSYEERTTSLDLFFGNPNLPPAFNAAAAQAQVESLIPAAQAPTSWAILVAGPANHPVSNADLDLMEAALRARGVPMNNIKKAKGTKKAMCDEIDALKNQNPPCDKVYFHFTGHGNKTCVYFGHPFDPANEKFTYKQLADKIKSTKGRSFCTSIESCQSGAGKAILEGTLGGGGVTSVDSNTLAGMTATGSVFTVAFAGCLTNRGASADTNRFPSYEEARRWATNVSAGARGQNPQGWGVPESFSRVLPAGYTTLGFNYYRGDNTLEEVLPNAVDGTVVSKWDPLLQEFEDYFFVFGIWFPDTTTLLPGEGAFIESPSPQPVLFSGEVQEPQSAPRLPPGSYLVGCRAPQPCGFETLMGFPPAIGDRVYTYPESSLTPPMPAVTHTFGVDGWDIEPILPPGYGAFVEVVEDPAEIAPGVDLLTTPPGGTTFQNFSGMPIPPGFFGPGSQPFTGRVEFAGVPLTTTPSMEVEPADTIVQRLGQARVGAGEEATVPIIITALSLASLQPITVTYQLGLPEQWNVRVHLSGVAPQVPGMMNIMGNPCFDGGTFNANLPVRPRFVFTRSSDNSQRVFDFGNLPGQPVVQFNTLNGHWMRFNPGFPLVEADAGFTVDHDGNPSSPEIGPLPGTSPNFFVGLRLARCQPGDCASPGQPQIRLTREQAMNAAHGVLPALNADLSDQDGDGFPDPLDNCPSLPNPLQADQDDDGVGDLCDNCVSRPNPCQQNCDADTQGDACERPGPLAIRRQGSNIVLSWPACPPGPYTLEATRSLGPVQWGPIITPPVLAPGNMWTVTLFAGGEARFFRLGKP